MCYVRLLNTNGNFSNVNGKRNSSGQFHHAHHLCNLQNFIWQHRLYFRSPWPFMFFKALLVSVENIKRNLSLPQLNSLPSGCYIWTDWRNYFMKNLQTISTVLSSNFSGFFILFLLLLQAWSLPNNQLFNNKSVIIQVLSNSKWMQQSSCLFLLQSTQ